MFINTSFGKTQQLIGKSMNAQSLRWQVISDNIANANTPNFKRMEVSFESQLQRAFQSEEEKPFKARLTDKKHIPFTKTINWQEVQPRKHLEYNTNMRNDKNNVDIEKELVLASKTEMTYNTLASVASRYYRKMGTVIR